MELNSDRKHQWLFPRTLEVGPVFSVSDSPSFARGRARVHESELYSSGSIQVEV